MPELVFGQIAVKVLFPTMLINTLHAGLEDAGLAFHGVAVDASILKVHILAATVACGAVGAEELTNVATAAVFIGHNARFLGDVLHNQRHESLRVYIVNHHSASLAAIAVDQSKILHLVMESAALRNALKLAYESLVHLYVAAITAKRGYVVRAHSLADTMRHKRSGFQSSAKNAVQLIAGNALLAASDRVHCLQPKAHRNLAVFEDGADLHSKGLAALVALPKPYAVVLSFSLPTRSIPPQ